jgi:hypothetical protein
MLQYTKDFTPTPQAKTHVAWAWLRHCFKRRKFLGLVYPFFPVLRNGSAHLACLILFWF